MERPLRVYVAGPLSKHGADCGANGIDLDALARADIAGQELFLLGCHPYIPHTMTSSWGLRPEPRFHSYDLVVRGLDFDYLQHFCDALLLLPGWVNSTGSKLELEEAERLCLPIFYSLDEVADFLANTWPTMEDSTHA
jgi:hypothetical protein